MEPIVIVLVAGIVTVLYCGYLLIKACCSELKSGIYDSVQIIQVGMMMPDQHLLEMQMNNNSESEDEESSEDTESDEETSIKT